jgi:hypothetical protein
VNGLQYDFLARRLIHQNSTRLAVQIPSKKPTSGPSYPEADRLGPGVLCEVIIFMEERTRNDVCEQGAKNAEQDHGSAGASPNDQHGAICNLRSSSRRWFRAMA